MRILVWLTAALAVAATSPAAALCSGESIDQEFKEADTVVKARLLGQIRAWSDEPTPEYVSQWGEGQFVDRSEWRVDEVFKGTPGVRIVFFQELNSGRFPFDLDRDYLLFLHRQDGPPKAADDSFYVRYACGQSKPWDEVAPDDLAEVRRLANDHKQNER